MKIEGWEPRRKRESGEERGMTRGGKGGGSFGVGGTLEKETLRDKKNVRKDYRQRRGITADPVPDLGEPVPAYHTPGGVPCKISKKKKK